MDLLLLLDGSSSSGSDGEGCENLARGGGNVSAATAPEVAPDISPDVANATPQAAAADGAAPAAAGGPTGGEALHAEERRTKKKRHSRLVRGSVEIVPSDGAPPDAFLRSVPHRRGHWSGHVKVAIATTEGGSPGLAERKSTSVARFRELLERNGRSGIVVEHGRLHLSLSKYFSLPLACIEPFVKRLSELVQHERCTHLHVETAEGRIILNEQESRSFWCWTVPTASSTLLRLVDHVDTVLRAYKQPLYYQPPHFHISIASFPGELKDLVTNENCNGARKLYEEHSSASSGDDDCESSDDTYQDSLVLPVTKLICTFGSTKEFTIALKGD